MFRVQLHIDMLYKAKKFPKKIRSRIDRHKRVRYHNDAKLFPNKSRELEKKEKLSRNQTDVNSTDDSYDF